MTPAQDVYELDSSSFPRAASLFDRRKEYVPVHSVLRGVFPGRVFVDDPVEPTAALVWALTRWSFVDGDPGRRAFLSGIADLIREVVRPTSLRLGLPWFEVYTPLSTRWESAIEEALAPLRPERHMESTFVADLAAYHRSRRGPIPPPGMRLEIVDCPIVPPEAEAVFGLAREMAQRTALGARLVEGDRVAALARSCGFETESEYMVDVETFSDGDRGKGLATIVSTALIDEGLRRGLLPLWETTHDNEPSRRLALRLGFVEGPSYPVYGMDLRG